MSIRYTPLAFKGTGSEKHIKRKHTGSENGFVMSKIYNGSPKEHIKFRCSAEETSKLAKFKKQMQTPIHI